MQQCSSCHTQLPQTAKFCFNCGQAQLSGLKTATKSIIQWDGDLQKQANKLLRKRLEERVKAEQDGRKLSDYQERIYESNYRETIHRRLKQWSDEVDVEAAMVNESPHLKALKKRIDDLLDFFFVVHCKDINSIVLNEALLQYQKADNKQTDGSRMALDFLHFEVEEERVYTDFIKLPVKKLKNAAQQFLFPEKEEKIWFICDQSLLGNAKEGFAMTDRALYWKSGLQQAQRVYYYKIASIQKEKDWLLINDLFFNATPSLNTKMIWLLRKLSRMH